LRAITSERDCGNHPCDRPPATALHQAGLGVALHDCAGDCAHALMDSKLTRISDRLIEYSNAISLLSPIENPSASALCHGHNVEAGSEALNRVKLVTPTVATLAAK
jgi:hypothetical protein